MPPPYTLHDLAKAAGITEHVVRHHIRRGWVPYAHGHAEKAYYDDVHMHRVLAIQALRKVHKVPFEKLGAILAKADDAEIRRLAGVPEPPPPPRGTSDGPGLWQRFPLAPGVELHVRIDLGGDVLTKVQGFQTAWAQSKG